MSYEFIYDQNIQAGFDYQIRVLELFLLHGVSENIKTFTLHTEVKQAQKFDDVIFQYTNDNEELQYIMVQVKHKQDVKKTPISYDDLFEGTKNKDFLLLKYFLSYQEIRQSGIFKNAKTDKLVVFTNTDFAREVYQNVILKKVDDSNLETIFPVPELYKLDKRNIVPLLKPQVRLYLKKTAKKLANFVLNNLLIDDQTFDLCHMFLARNVIDRHKSQFFESFVNDKHLSGSSCIIRSALESEFKKISKNLLTLQNVNDAIFEKRKINGKRISMNFKLKDDTIIFGEGVNDEWTNDQDLNNKIEDFVDCFIFAIKQPSEKEIVSVIEKKIKLKFGSNVKESQIKMYEEMKRISRAKKRVINYSDSKRLFDSFYISFNVTDPVMSFTGRTSELGHLHTLTQQRNKENSQNVTVVTTISGLGGIGKTQLVRKYVKLYDREYDRNIIWIDAETESSVIDCFHRLAGDKLDIDLKNKYGYDKNIKSIVEEVYKYFENKKSLFVFDNCEDTRLFNAYLPADATNISFLITSRNRNWGRHVEMIDLAVLSEVDAIALIETSLKIAAGNPNPDVRELAQTLQCLPLAIQQAISYINNKCKMDRKYKIGNYLKEFEKNASVLLENEDFLTEAHQGYYTKTTLMTWIISLETIASNKIHGELALRILKIIIYIQPEKIPRKMFLELENVTEENLYEAVNLLINYSIINGKENQEMLDIHRLTQHVIRIHERRNEKDNLETALHLITYLKSKDPWLIYCCHFHESCIWNFACKYPEFIQKFIVDEYIDYRVDKDCLISIIEHNQIYALRIIKYIKENCASEFSYIINGTLNTVNMNEDSYLFLAVGSNNLQIVQLLEEEGANMNITNCCGSTALHYAAYWGHKDIVSHLLVKYPNIDVIDYDGRTTLHHAANRGYKNVVDLLLENGADVNIVDNHGINTLHHAAAGGLCDFVSFLLETGFNIEKIDKEGKSTIHHAALNGQKEVVDLLLGNGADINVRDKEGKTALHHVVVSNRIQNNVEWLLEKGVDVNAIDENGITALHRAANWGYQANVDSLLKNGADVNIVGKDGMNTLHYAACGGLCDFVSFLLRTGFSVETVDQKGRTALHHATLRKNLNVVDLLLGNGADVNVVDEEGKTALQYAVSRRYKQIVDFLLKNGAV